MSSKQIKHCCKCKFRWFCLRLVLARTLLSHNFRYIFYTCIYLYWWKFNAAFNKLIKKLVTVLVFSKNDVEHTHLVNNFDFIWIFSYSHLSSPLVETKHWNCKVCKFCALPCIKQYVHGKRLKSIISKTNNLKRHFLKQVSLIIWYIDFVMTTYILHVFMCVKLNSLFDSERKV